MKFDNNINYVTNSQKSWIYSCFVPVRLGLLYKFEKNSMELKDEEERMGQKLILFLKLFLLIQNQRQS